MKNPALSIIMPTYNRPDETKEMIESVIASTFGDWELIIVDDGSDKQTLSLLASYADTDKRIHLHQRTRLPKGAQTCRNTGFELSQGLYVIFFDSDDYVCPQCIGQRVMYMQQNPDVDFIVFPSASMDENGLHENTWCNNFGYCVNKDDIQAFASRRLPFVVWNNIYRRSSLKKHGICWDEQLKSFQDSDFNLATLLSGMKYRYAKQLPLFYYRIPLKRQGNTSIVGEMFAKSSHQQSHIYLTQKWLNTIPQHFGHKYDKYIYDGIIFIIRFHHENSHSWHMAHELCKIMKNYSQWMWIKLNIHTKLGELFQTILPPSKAFTLAFLPYKIRDWIKAKERIHRIKTIYYHNKKSNQHVP